MDNPLIFSLARLKTQGKIRMSEVVEPAAFEGTLKGLATPKSPVTVELQAEWREERVWLSGTASGDWELQCCRCLAAIRKKYSACLDAVIDDAEELVNAEEELRQTLLLAVPTQPYCRTDCRGLCAQCGQDKNIKDCGCTPMTEGKGSIPKVIDRREP